jgi:thioredoxin reductase (NADPH)
MPYYSPVPVDAVDVLAVPADRLRELVARDAGLGDLILRACLIRRSILIGLGVGLRIVGSRYSPDAQRLRDFTAATGSRAGGWTWRPTRLPRH